MFKYFLCTWCASVGPAGSKHWSTMAFDHVAQQAEAQHAFELTLAHAPSTSQLWRRHAGRLPQFGKNSRQRILPFPPTVLPPVTQPEVGFQTELELAPEHPVIKDELEKLPGRRYKAFYCSNSGYKMRYSSDGLNWGDEVALPGVGESDCHANMIWSPPGCSRLGCPGAPALQCHNCSGSSRP